jgi:hypothetical protein
LIICVIVVRHIGHLARRRRRTHRKHVLTWRHGRTQQSHGRSKHTAHATLRCNAAPGTAADGCIVASGHNSCMRWSSSSASWRRTDTDCTKDDDCDGIVVGAAGGGGGGAGGGGAGSVRMTANTSNSWPTSRWCCARAAEVANSRLHQMQIKVDGECSGLSRMWCWCALVLEKVFAHGKHRTRGMVNGGGETGTGGA